VNVIINGKEYAFVGNAIKDDQHRESYFALINKVFGLDFAPWHQAGFCVDDFVPYTLFDGGVAVASAGIVINRFKWQGQAKKYVQISTVATHPDYRKKGLSRWLMDRILEDWKGNCDGIYLYANDSVVDFYPQFGFVEACEHRYSMPITRVDGSFRKLDLSSKDDVDLLIKKHKEGNPYAALGLDDCVEIMMFHCINFLYDNIYYIQSYDAIVIAVEEDGEIFCYDIYSAEGADIGQLLGIVAGEGVEEATLGFTPKDVAGFTIEKADEENEMFFVMDGKENILADNKITFPFLSKA